jgi:ribosomal protein L37AE/L43A
MKLVKESGEYTPMHCSECSKESIVTIYLTNHVWLCFECIRKASNMVDNYTAKLNKSALKRMNQRAEQLNL